MKIKNIALVFLCFSFLFGGNINQQLRIAGKNKKEIKKALRKAPKDHREGMHWLIKHMPDEDLKSVTSEFLLENCELAYKAWEETAWGREIPEDVFFEYVLPFANLNEKRESWRKDFYYRFSDIMRNSASGYQAAASLNNKMFEMVGVKYSTKRPKADQAPYESMDAGLASCTGLSILLIDACRSIGVPARFVGTPMWYNNSGNHSWVEIWDNGWHVTGAAEPTGDELNNFWFSGLASRAVEGHPKYGVYAATWADSDIHFPMDWLPGVDLYNAVDVTASYIKNIDKNLVPIRIRALDDKGERQQVAVVVTGEDNFWFEGVSKNESSDSNDHLTLMLPKGKEFIIKTNGDEQKINIEKEKIVDLKIYNK